MKIGEVVAVCVSGKSGVPKYQVDEAMVAQYGFRDDYHCKPMRRSFSKPGTEKPNTDRHLTIVAEEAVFAVCDELGISRLPIGALGENILVRGLGDLSEITPETTILIGSDIYLIVTEQNVPCQNLAPYHPHFIKKIFGRRGLLCVVESGIGKTVRAGDFVTPI